MWPLSTFQFCDHENSQQQNKTCHQVCDLDTTWYNMRYFAPLTIYNKMSIWSKISCCFLCLYFFYLWLSGSGFYKNWSMVSEWSVDQWWLIVQSARQKVINRKIREFLPQIWNALKNKRKVVINDLQQVLLIKV